MSNVVNLTVQVCKGRLINRHYTYYYNVKSVNFYKGNLYLTFHDNQVERLKLDPDTEYLIS